MASLETVDTSERGFQKLILKELTQSQDYELSFSSDFDKSLCINQEHLFRFLKQTQEDIYEMILSKGKQAFLNRVDKKIQKEGIVNTLKKGVKYFDKTVKLFYSKPVSKLNEKDNKNYDENIFSVCEELIYTTEHKNRIDLVIFLNGFPIITFELKNAFTKQAVKDAIRQYQNDRDPKDKIFNFKRCFLHLAMDTDSVYMCTKLSGRKTFFLPFNKGLNDGKPFEPFGAGNPESEDGIKTSYIYNEILQKNSLSNIVDKFVKLIDEEDEDTKKVTQKLIFPRYHQLMAVRNLLKDVKDNGIGKRYLIQHSAGSGKSNSISWLAHQLVALHNSEDENIFNSIIIVTDRTVLDKQLRNNVISFAENPKVVGAIMENGGDSKTNQLQTALANKKKIIISTIQTFPYVLKQMDSITDGKFAIIIDEAHSSQSGETSKSLNAVLSDVNLEEIKDEFGEIDNEKLISALIQNRKMLSNASYFAFTATPKNKTLEIFGEKKEDGGFYAFHTYSMKQAIQEEFILDVLGNYTTYQSFYKLVKAVQNNPTFNTKEAQKKLRSYVEAHEYSIKQKARIMIDHFLSEVRTLINGKAKAMVVTKSIESAIKYKQAFDEYLIELKMPCKAIVAFSGKKTYKGIDYTENSMNSFEDGNNNIPKQFKKNEFRFLIVANKYQTGFDEPLLHTMYVDKKLDGVQAIQTLSRLNRAKKPYKKDTFVLDFFNKTEDIKEAFKNYYSTTVLSEETDVNKLNDLQDDLENTHVYEEQDLDELFSVYYGKEQDRGALEKIINKSVTYFDDELSLKEKVEFKSNAKSFLRTYSYLSKVIDFENQTWEKMWLYLKLLVTKLKIDDDKEEDENILEAIDMDSYKLIDEGTKKIALDDSIGVIEPVPVSIGGGLNEEELDTLDNILKAFNDRFGNIPWDNPDKVQEVLVKEIPNELRNNTAVIETIANSSRDNAKDASDKKVKEIMQTFIRANTEIFKIYMNNEGSFQNRYNEYIFDILLEEAKRYANNKKYNYNQLVAQPKPEYN
ncbi:type I restriction endonuclease subunit R [Halarcobacter ebronensis]|uniref:DEAD/DEAH box helicase n=1 Tax=Halarcobacter ebronensis TaxID=1462615 RepID=A0A4V1M0C0_9BACT|nr:type I restriction endonuclease [Halarcobacter ebronensis]QKF81750.1 type I restriction/modification system, restriction subunit [Halarcobacter ebronensis]RXK04572.1 DEAD/DEAH box helicase [Halarcobacter ebronensis]